MEGGLVQRHPAGVVEVREDEEAQVPGEAAYRLDGYAEPLLVPSVHVGHAHPQHLEDLRQGLVVGALHGHAIPGLQERQRQAHQEVRLAGPRRGQDVLRTHAVQARHETPEVGGSSFDAPGQVHRIQALEVPQGNGGHVAAGQIVLALRAVGQEVVRQLEGGKVHVPPSWGRGKTYLGRHRRNL